MLELLNGVFFPISGALYADNLSVDLASIETDPVSLDLLLFSPEEHAAFPSQPE